MLYHGDKDDTISLNFARQTYTTLLREKGLDHYDLIVEKGLDHEALSEKECVYVEKFLEARLT